MNSPNRPLRIAIIGSGITGLAAAQRFLEGTSHADITVFEAKQRLGGVIQTTIEDGFVFEHGADNFIVSDELPWAGRLCQEIGLETIGTSEKHRRALILRGDKLYPVPEGLHLMSVRQISSILTSPLLSLRGRLRVACEPFIPAADPGREESLAEFATRRFGREMFERIVQPLVSGIYTADPEKLSVAAALPQFAALERKFGSLRAAAKATLVSRATERDRGARYALFRSPRDGMQSLIDYLEQHLAAVKFRRSCGVKELRQGDKGWILTDANGDTNSFSGVIVATSAPASARLLNDVSPEAAIAMQEIEHVSTTVVGLGFCRDQIKHPLDAFGLVVPAIERQRILALSFTHVKYPSRCPPGHALMRVFLGGALQPELAELTDEDSEQVAWQDSSRLLEIIGKPTFKKVVRWPQTTPQYHLGHIDRSRRISKAMEQLPGLECAGNAYNGIGIPQCVRSGWEAADRLLVELDPRAAQGSESR